MGKSDGFTSKKVIKPIGATGTLPHGVSPVTRKDHFTGRETTDATRAAVVKPRKTARPKLSDLKGAHTVHIMRGHAVPMPAKGDRRALIAPGRKADNARRTTRDATDYRTFAIVEFIGKTCAIVHGGTDDYRQARVAAESVARGLQRWLNRGAVATAKRNGRILGKETTVKIVDRSGLAPRRPRVKGDGKPAKSEAESAPVTVRQLTEDERIQQQHRADIRSNKPCRNCNALTGPHLRCGVLPEREALKAMRTALAWVDRESRNRESDAVALDMWASESPAYM